MKNSKDILDNVFIALASKHRRAIVHHLSLQPTTITYLAKQLRLSLPAIHKHIKILEHARLLQRRKSGRSNFLALNREGLMAQLEWIGQYNPHWGNNKESLENYINRIQQENN